MSLGELAQTLGDILPNIQPAHASRTITDMRHSLDEELLEQVIKNGEMD